MDHGAVFPAVPVDPALPGQVRCREGHVDGPGREDAVAVQGQELFPGVGVLLQSGGVDVEQRTVLGVVDPHGHRAGVEQGVVMGRVGLEGRGPEQLLQGGGQGAARLHGARAVGALTALTST